MDAKSRERKKAGKKSLAPPSSLVFSQYFPCEVIWQCDTQSFGAPQLFSSATPAPNYRPQWRTFLRSSYRYALSCRVMCAEQVKMRVSAKLPIIDGNTIFNGYLGGMVDSDPELNH